MDVDLVLLRSDKRHRIGLNGIEKMAPASGAFPYWIFWEPINKEGQRVVKMYSVVEVMEIQVTGEPEEPTLASVTPLSPKETR